MTTQLVAVNAGHDSPLVSFVHIDINIGSGLSLTLDESSIEAAFQNCFNVIKNSRVQYTPIKSGGKIIPKKAESIKISAFLNPAIAPNYDQILPNISISRLK